MNNQKNKRSFSSHKHSDSLSSYKYTLFDRVSHRISASVGYRSMIFITKNIPEYHYFEVQIMSDNGDARIGIATEQAEVNGPIGMDGFGYSYGSRNGYFFHKGKRTVFGERFKKEDIVSCLFINKSKTLVFYLNGTKVQQSITNIKEGVYWPACSAYKNTILDINTKKVFDYQIKIFNDCGMEIKK